MSRLKEIGLLMPPPPGMVPMMPMMPGMPMGPPPWGPPPGPPPPMGSPPGSAVVGSDIRDRLVDLCRQASLNRRATEEVDRLPSQAAIDILHMLMGQLHTVRDPSSWVLDAVSRFQNGGGMPPAPGGGHGPPRPPAPEGHGPSREDPQLAERRHQLLAQMDPHMDDRARSVLRDLDARAVVEILEDVVRRGSDIRNPSAFVFRAAMTRLNPQGESRNPRDSSRSRDRHPRRERSRSRRRERSRSRRREQSRSRRRGRSSPQGDVERKLRELTRDLDLDDRAQDVLMRLDPRNAIEIVHDLLGQKNTIRNRSGWIMKAASRVLDGAPPPLRSDGPMDPAVERELDDMAHYAGIDGRAREALANLPAADALQVMRELVQLPPEDVRNPSAWVCFKIKGIRDRHGERARQGPSEDSFAEPLFDPDAPPDARGAGSSGARLPVPKRGIVPPPPFPPEHPDLRSSPGFPPEHSEFPPRHPDLHPEGRSDGHADFADDSQSWGAGPIGSRQQDFGGVEGDDRPAYERWDEPDPPPDNGSNEHDAMPPEVGEGPPPEEGGEFDVWGLAGVHTRAPAPESADAIGPGHGAGGEDFWANETDGGQAQDSHWPGDETDNQYSTGTSSSVPARPVSASPPPGDWRELSVEQWLKDVDGGKGFLSAYRETLEANYDNVEQIIDLYVAEDAQSGRLMLDASFFSEVGVEKLGHRRLFERWVGERLVL